MALTYPIDTAATAGKWYLYDTETQEVSKMSGTGDWPDGDGAEIVGLPANLVPLLAVADDKPVDIDSRLVRLEGEQQAPDIENNEIRTKWTIKNRTKPEKLDVTNNIEFEQMAKHFNPNKLLLEVCILLGAILRKNKNLNVPAPLQAHADKFEGKAIKLYKNRLKIDQILAAIEAGEQPQLDQDWEAPDPE